MLYVFMAVTVVDDHRELCELCELCGTERQWPLPRPPVVGSFHGGIRTCVHGPHLKALSKNGLSQVVSM